MSKIRFEWDESKNALNIRKHDVSFEIAVGIFGDPYMIDIYDERHSGYNKYGIWEDRFAGIGYIGKVLYVVYTVRERSNDEVIRIISARPAEIEEIELYKKSRGR